MRYQIDSSVRRLPAGALLGGSPLRLFRLTAPGSAMFDSIARGDDVASNTLIVRLTHAGVLHPQPGLSSSHEPCDVTIVVPAFGRQPARPNHVGPVIVVDDGSPIALDAADVRRPINGGPGAARMTGLALVTTPLVAFVDTDVQLPADWLAALLGHFDDPTVALVAPRVRATPGLRFLDRYDTARSPLDLGTEPARVMPRTRVGYLPTAAVVARAQAIESVGGFDPKLRTGEDVDLIWRLIAAGHQVRYEPLSEVTHSVRREVTGLLRQRYGYGRSAAPLARRHRTFLAPVGMNVWSAVAWAAACVGHPGIGVLVGLGSAAALPRKLSGVPKFEAFMLAARGNLGAGRQLASAATRVWWPLLILTRRGRRLWLVSAVVPGLMDWWRVRCSLDPLRFVVMRAADDAAYGAGVWRGMLAEQTLAPIIPDLTNATPRALNGQQAER